EFGAPFGEPPLATNLLNHRGKGGLGATSPTPPSDDLAGRRGALASWPHLATDGASKVPESRRRGGRDRARDPKCLPYWTNGPVPYVDGAQASGRRLRGN